MKKLILLLVIAVVAVTSFAQNKYAEISFLTPSQAMDSDGVHTLMYKRILTTFGTFAATLDEGSLYYYDRIDLDWDEPEMDDPKNTFLFYVSKNENGIGTFIRMSKVIRSDYLACVNRIRKDYGEVVSMDKYESEECGYHVTEFVTFKMDEISVSVSYSEREWNKEKWICINYMKE